MTRSRHRSSALLGALLLLGLTAPLVAIGMDCAPAAACPMGGMEVEPMPCHGGARFEEGCCMDAPAPAAVPEARATASEVSASPLAATAETKRSTVDLALGARREAAAPGPDVGLFTLHASLLI